MNDNEILEGNKLIAEFMERPFFIHKTAQYPLGYPYTSSEGHGGLQPLEYHSSWGWLMEVVEKIQYDLPQDYV